MQGDLRLRATEDVEHGIAATLLHFLHEMMNCRRKNKPAANDAASHAAASTDAERAADLVKPGIEGAVIPGDDRNLRFKWTVINCIELHNAGGC